MSLAWVEANKNMDDLVLVNGNMFLENGNMFLVNGKPFLDKSQISCGFLKYAWFIFKATPVRNILPNVKTYILPFH